MAIRRSSTIRSPWRTIGTVTEVEREEQTFIVSVSRDAEEISLQEMRGDRYDSVE